LHFDPAINRADERLQLLATWARSILATDDLRISVASADASFRRYFRVHSPSGTWIVMDAPPAQENVEPYIAIARMLVAAGVNAPIVHAQDLASGFLLLSDLGDRTYLMDLSNGQRSEELYRDALGALVRMQLGCEPGTRDLPPYDAALLKREMELFPDWLLDKHFGITLDAATRAKLDDAFAILIETALDQPRVFVHRDYHSRNLMVIEDERRGANPGVLDFQDAVHGPVTYDLVSLLRDCYIAWPLERVHAWLRDYRILAAQGGIDVGASEQQFLRWFDLMGVQRHLKASGIFARLWHRDGKRGYLNDIPRTLDYIRAVLPTYPELHFIAPLLESWTASLRVRS